MTFSQFFHSCKSKSSHLHREFIWILTEKFKIDEAKIISGELSLTKEHQLTLNDWMDKKEQDYPLQYFIGSTEFLGYEFKVSPGVLIPRGETEEIASWVIGELKNKKIDSMIDIGTGSGCLGIGTALGLESLKELVLLEPFYDEVLGQNIKNLCEGKTFETKLEKVLFENYKFEKLFDLILSNPPYIRHGDPDVAKGVYEFEPHEALFGGKLGWEKVIEWAERCYANLKPDGLLVFEISHDQRDDIEKRLTRFGPVIHKDSFGRDRFMIIRKSGE